MLRPETGDRWQNRRTDRLCVVEVIEGGLAAATTRIGFRYEKPTTLGKRPRLQWTSLAYFVVAFAPYETKGGR